MRPSAARIGAGDAAEMVQNWLPDLVAMRTVGIGREDRAGLAVLDFGHDEERPLQRRAIEFQRDRFRHRQAERVERLIGAIFGRALGLDQARRRIAAQDQAAFDDSPFFV